MVPVLLKAFLLDREDAEKVGTSAIPFMAKNHFRAFRRRNPVQPIEIIRSLS